MADTRTQRNLSTAVWFMLALAAILFILWVI